MMLRTWSYRIAIVLALMGAMALFSTPAYAHERRDVGAYRLVVGWLNEPAFVEEPNAVSLAVTRISDNSPVEGVERTLKVALSYAGGRETEPQPLRARFGMPGNYLLDVFPTRTGEYTFHFTGEIDGQTVDERFVSGPGRFGHIEAKTTLMFPEQESTIAEAARAAGTARSLGLVGAVAGILGLLAGLAALIMTLGTRARARPAFADSPIGPERGEDVSG